MLRLGSWMTRFLSHAGQEVYPCSKEGRRKRLTRISCFQRIWKEDKLGGKSSGVIRVSFPAITSQCLGEQWDRTEFNVLTGSRSMSTFEVHNGPNAPGPIKSWPKLQTQFTRFTNSISSIRQLKVVNLFEQWCVINNWQQIMTSFPRLRPLNLPCGPVPLPQHP
jgi:hypothetical protein